MRARSESFTIRVRNLRDQESWDEWLQRFQHGCGSVRVPWWIMWPNWWESLYLLPIVHVSSCFDYGMFNILKREKLPMHQIYSLIQRSWWMLGKSWTLLNESNHSSVTWSTNAAGERRLFLTENLMQMLYFRLVAEVETVAFRKEFGNDFPDIEELMAKVSQFTFL